jgi:hypothetical protein
MGALKYNVTFFFVEGDPTARPSFSGGSDTVAFPYGEMLAVDGKNTVSPRLTIK